MNSPRSIAFFLLALSCVVLWACGDSDDDGGSTSTATTSTSTSSTSGSSSSSAGTSSSATTSSPTTTPSTGTSMTTDTSTTGTGTTGTTPDDAGTADTGEEDTGGEDTGGEDVGTGDVPPDDVGSGLGNLSGNVTRSTEPSNGGIGGLFIAVFDRNPILDQANAQLVGFTLVEDADMSAANASIAFEITEIPPRSEPYFGIAFLDDNNTATIDDPAPDRGDLVSLENFAPVEISIPQAGDYTQDIVLNTVLPF